MQESVWDRRDDPLVPFRYDAAEVKIKKLGMESGSFSYWL